MSAAIPLSIPDDLRNLVRQTAEETHLSQQDVICQSIQAGIPKVRARFKTGSDRVTNVEPLPDDVLKRIYDRPEEDDEEGVRCFIKAQAFGGED